MYSKVKVVREKIQTWDSKPHLLLKKEESTIYTALLYSLPASFKREKSVYDSSS